MTIDSLKRALLFLIFVVAQALVLGRIHLFNCATPLLYVYFVTMFPRNYPKAGVLVWSFMLGLVIDIFTNTPGLAAFSLTLIGAIQPYYFSLFVPRDSAESLEPSIASIGVLRYSYYIVALVLLYCLVFFSLEMFTFFNWEHWALCVGGSTLLTLAFIYVFEYVRGK